MDGNQGALPWTAPVSFEKESYKMKLPKQVADQIEANQSEMLETLRTLIAFPSIATAELEDGYPFGKPCADALRFMLQKAEQMGFSAQNFDDYIGSVDWMPEAQQQPELGILCHLDVVPVLAENWSSDPFVMEERDGCLFGRGCIDDKGPAVAVLYAMKAIRDAGVPLQKNVRFIMGCNEENGSSDLEYYQAHAAMPPHVFTPDGNYPLISIEKGMLRLQIQKQINDPICFMQAGTAPNAVPAVAEAQLTAAPQVPAEQAHLTVQGNTWQYTGLAAHASTPQTGDNAITGLCTALAQDARFSDCQALLQLFPHGVTDGSGLGIACTDETSGALTCICSMLTVEDGCMTGTVDIRFPLCTSKEALLQQLQERFAAYGFSCEALLASDPHCVPESDPFVQTLLAVYEAETGQPGQCLAIGGGTYVHDIPGGVAFGAEFPGWDYHMHGDDEFMPLAHLMQDVRMIAAAILALCAEEK